MGLPHRLRVKAKFSRSLYRLLPHGTEILADAVRFSRGYHRLPFLSPDPDKHV